MFLKTSLFCIVACLVSCSSGPKTQYYTMYSTPENLTTLGRQSTYGIGPIELPVYIDSSSVVTKSDTSRILVLGYHAWAGDLQETVTRVLSESMNTILGSDGFWPFPWDNRIRPDYQIRISIDDFAGVRGESVSLVVRWTLLNQTATEILAKGHESYNHPLQGAEVADYVSGLNQLLIEFAQDLSRRVELFSNSKTEPNSEME